jgi:hypothetical protein
LKASQGQHFEHHVLLQPKVHTPRDVAAQIRQ